LSICTDCELHKSSHIGDGLYSCNKLMGAGNSDATIMFVDSHPKEEEIKQKKPFVGVEGQLVFRLARGLGISDTYYTYVAKCKPAYGQKLGAVHIQACNKHIAQEIAKVQPKVIIVLGGAPLAAFGILDAKITKIRGIPIWHEEFNCWIVPTYSPAYINNFVENSHQQKQFKEDLAKALKISIDGNIVEKPKDVKYEIAKTIEDVARMTKVLLAAEWIAGDIEFDSLDYFRSNLVLNSFSIAPYTGMVIPYHHPGAGYGEEWKAKVLPYLKQIWESDVKKIFQFDKTDIQVLRTNGIFVRQIAFDTCLAHALLDENSPHGLGQLIPIYTDMGNYKDEVVDYLAGRIKVPLEGVFQEGKDYFRWVDLRSLPEVKLAEDALKKKSTMYRRIDEKIRRKLYLSEALRKSNIYDCPYDQLAWYAAQDADGTMRLKEVFWGLLEKEGLLKHLLKIDVPLSYVLAQMEYKGIGVDREYVEKMFRETEDELIAADDAVLDSPQVKAYMGKYQVPNGVFNTASSDQVSNLLFNEMGLIAPVYNKLTSTQKISGQKKGTPSVAIKPLQILLEQNKIKVLEDLIRISKIAKTVEYFESYLKLINESPDGRIHTTYNQIKMDSDDGGGGTVTGRLSSKNPNLQNITKRGDKAKLIRRSFAARPGYTFIAADYKQIEFVIWGHASGDPNLLKFINEEQDIHIKIAAISRKIPEDQITSIVRNVAKMTVYGMIYGRSTYSIAQEYGMSDFEVEMFVNGFFKLFPVATQFLQDNIQLMQKQGYITNIFGRRRRVLEMFSKDKFLRASGERKVRNFPLQGGAADLVFLAMNKVFRTYLDFQNSLGIDMIRNPELSVVDSELQIHDEIVSECKDEYLDQIVPLKINAMENAAKLKCATRVDVKIGKNLGELMPWKGNLAETLKG